MTLKYIRETYDLPFVKRGMSVHVCEGWGIVVGARGGRLQVKPNGCLYAIGCHPTSDITYYDSTSGDIIKKFQ